MPEIKVDSWVKISLLPSNLNTKEVKMNTVSNNPKVTPSFTFLDYINQTLNQEYCPICKMYINIPKKKAHECDVQKIETKSFPPSNF
jgi:hypothetical protein